MMRGADAHINGMMMLTMIRLQQSGNTTGKKEEEAHDGFQQKNGSSSPSQ